MNKPLARLITMIIVLMVTFAFGATAEASPGAHASVVGGKPAPAGTFPWMAYISIHLVGRAYAYCSGTVISPNVVLTAGHCVKDVDTGEKYSRRSFKVTTGSVDHTDRSATQAIGVSQTVLDRHYDRPTGHGDAALLILSRPTSAPPIALAGAADGGLLQAGTPITIAGWGLTSASARSAPEHLRWGNSVIQSSDRCSSGVSSYYPYFDPTLQLCAVDVRAHDVVPCSGDSGGPAFALRPDNTPVQVGITDIVAPGCSPQYPAIFVRVGAISGWAGRWTDIARLPGSAVPTMTRKEANIVARKALSTDFGAGFRRHRGFEAGCSRTSRTRFHCHVAWRKNGKDFSGGVSVFNQLSDMETLWDASYTIHSVHAGCHSAPKHRRRCAIRTTRRR